MSAFDETIKPALSYIWSDTWGTLVAGPYPSGRTIRRAKRAYPLYRAKLVYPQVSDFSSYANLLDFIAQRKGPAGEFTFFDFQGWDSATVGVPWKRLYIGVRDGSTVNWDLPIKTGSSFTVRSNGSAMTNTSPSAPAGATQYRVVAGAGTDGRDQLQLGAAGTSGHILECDATGRRALNAVIGNDEIEWENPVALLTGTGLRIEEVRS